MRIAIDASRTTLERITGTEHYARELIRHLIRLNDQLPQPHQLILYFRDAPQPATFPPSAHVIQRVIPLHRLWTHLGFAYGLLRDRPDVVWVPAHTLPFVFVGKSVVTVHDLGYRHFPQTHAWSQWLLLEAYTRFSAWRATRVLADSHATARDLTRFYGTPTAKIEVVYPGVTVPPVEHDLASVRQKYHLPDHYWLFIGTLQPRKNIKRLVSAYHHWRANHPNAPIALVLAGGKGWKYDESWTKGASDVHLIGYIDEADKGALIQGAVALVFPSLYEGFGFPIVEAMALGTPVICSNTSSLPELGGNATLLVDPHVVGHIANAMRRLTHDALLRAQLVQAGYAQAQQFNWERSAQQILQALVKVGQDA